MVHGDSYGMKGIRESAGRGDMNNNTLMTSTDTTRFTNAMNGTIWDPRADLDDERARGGSVKGDVDASDQTFTLDTTGDSIANAPRANARRLLSRQGRGDAKQPGWASEFDAPTVAQAFSDADNPFMFQGVTHFALDTAGNATEDKLSLNHHRARFEDCPTGRWCTRDPLSYGRVRPPSVPVHIYSESSSSLPRVESTRLYEWLGSNSTARRDYTGWTCIPRYCLGGYVELTLTITGHGTPYHGGTCPSDDQLSTSRNSFHHTDTCPEGQNCYATDDNDVHSFTLTSCVDTVKFILQDGTMADGVPSNEPACQVLLRICNTWSIGWWLGVCI